MDMNQIKILRGRILTALDDGPCTSDELHNRIGRCVNIASLYAELRGTWMRPYAIVEKIGQRMIWKLVDGIDITKPGGCTLPKDVATPARSNGNRGDVGIDHDAAVERAFGVDSEDPPQAVEDTPTIGDVQRERVMFDQGKDRQGNRIPKENPVAGTKIVIRPFVPAQDELAIEVLEHSDLPTMVVIKAFKLTEVKAVIEALKVLIKQGMPKGLSKRTAEIVAGATSLICARDTTSHEQLLAYLKEHELLPAGPGTSKRVTNLLLKHASARVCQIGENNLIKSWRAVA